MRIKTERAAMVEINMTPMIDIVFQLIAFFMVVINFEQTQADERVKLPKDELARPPKTARPDKRVINIGYNRDKQGNIKGAPIVWLPGITRSEITDDKDPRYPNGYAWPADEDACERDLAKIKRSLSRDEKLKETTIVIRTDGEIPGGVTTDVVNRCQKKFDFNGTATNGFEKFEFSATQKGRTNEKQ